MGEPSFTCIEVEDEGIGMGADALAHVFDRYHDDGDGEQSAGGGAHLGLHIARALVDAHDGRLRIESSLGVGTTASVYLPTDRATARMLSRLRQAEEAARVAWAARRDLTLLLIDDDAITGDALHAEWARTCLLNPEHATFISATLVWIIRDGLALALVSGGDALTGVATAGACPIDDNMTFGAALRAAARDLEDQKNNRVDRAVPGPEPVREQGEIMDSIRVLLVDDERDIVDTVK